jgi:hypothetical protein
MGSGIWDHAGSFAATSHATARTMPTKSGTTRLPARPATFGRLPPAEKAAVCQVAAAALRASGLLFNIVSPSLLVSGPE